MTDPDYLILVNQLFQRITRYLGSVAMGMPDIEAY
jgi:hypothetical protein